MSLEKDLKFMELAIQEAKKGIGKVSPNPIVGAVIAKNDQLISKGHHSKFGGPHAEIIALERAENQASHATLYVTLEPCSTFGKTPPCTDAIVNSGVARVVIGSLDPNPIHHGKGIKILKRKGLLVEIGVLKKETDNLNPAFQKWMKTKIPYCIVKSALSLDGKIATRSGYSKWITGSEARRASHILRSEVDAIMVGINTVVKDDPELTTHDDPNGHPFKIVIDSHARIPLNSKLIKNHAKELILAVTTEANPQRIETLRRRGVKIIMTSPKEKKVDIRRTFLNLGQLGISSILVEGGGMLISSVLKEKLADQIYFFYAPILIGGKNAPTNFEGDGISNLEEAIQIKDLHIVNPIGHDFLVKGHIVYRKRKKR